MKNTVYALDTSNQRIRKGLASEITETEIDQELQAHRAAE
jgi:hypothetical protein